MAATGLFSGSAATYTVDVDDVIGGTTVTVEATTLRIGPDGVRRLGFQLFLNGSPFVVTVNYKEAALEGTDLFGHAKGAR